MRNEELPKMRERSRTLLDGDRTRDKGFDLPNCRPVL